MVILEALQNELPCVATSVSGHPEAIHDGQTGYLVALDRPDEMAVAALKILNDPVLGSRMGEQGRRLVSERFAVSGQVEAYLDLYSGLHARSTALRTRRKTNDAAEEERS